MNQSLKNLPIRYIFEEYQIYKLFELNYFDRSEKNIILVRITKN
jgi:hypothetical protein